MNVENSTINQEKSGETLGDRVQKRMEEFLEDTFDDISDVQDTEKFGDQDRRGIDATMRIRDNLIVPDITTGGKETVEKKVKSMQRNPFVEIGDEQALRIIIHANPDDWQSYCDEADKAGRRVSECIPHDLLVREKKKIISQIVGEVASISVGFKGDKKKTRVLEDVQKAMAEEWQE